MPETRWKHTLRKTAATVACIAAFAGFPKFQPNTDSVSAGFRLAHAQQSADNNQEISKLMSKLRKGNSSERREARESLVGMGKPAVPELIRALKDENWQVREETARALAKIGDSRALVSLIDALKDSNEDVRKEVSYALVKIKKSSDQLDSLLDMLVGMLRESGDQNAEVGAAETLGMLGEYEVLNDPAKAVSVLVATFDGETNWKNYNLRQIAAKSLLKIAEKYQKKLRSTVPGILKEIGNKDSDVRETIAIALGRIGDERAIPGLIALFRDKSDKVRHEATLSLAKIGKPAFIELTRAMKDSDWNVRYHASVALSTMASDNKIDKIALQVLIELLENRDPKVRHCAVLALEHIEDPIVKGAMIKASKDPYPKVRMAAISALKTLIEEPRDEDPAVVTALAEALRDNHKGVRIKAAIALGYTGDPRAIPILNEASRNNGMYVRLYTARALGMTKDVRAIPSLEVLLKDRNEMVRSDAASSLSFIKSKMSVRVLISALADRSDMVKFCAVNALVEIGEYAIPDLTAAQKSGNRSIREQATQALKEIKSKKK